MYNKMMMIGRLTAQPELQQTANGKSVLRVTVAVNRRFKGENGEREADFFQVVWWGKQAESLADYAGKGSLIFVEGELRSRRYEREGQTHYVTEINGSNFQLLESRTQRAMRENKGGEELTSLVIAEEDLPF